MQCKNTDTGGDTGTDPGTDPVTDPGTGSTCDVCSQITAALECPGWGDMMDDVTGAIKNAMPPPPDWDMVADKIGQATIDHLDDYMGDVPPVPSKAEIEKETQAPLPQLDISTKEEDTLVPQVPEEYKKGAIVFELDSTPAIPTKDESKPFDITDPMSNVKYDKPGVPVMPGDKRNDSGDIENPSKVDTGSPPIPKTSSSEGETAPTPKTSSSPPPTPTTGSGTAYPAPTTGTIPIPKME